VTRATASARAGARVGPVPHHMLPRSLRLQASVENVVDTRYYLNADGNTNISPGSPRAVRLALTAAF
jgi:catecholate siderophore receptor